MFTLFPAAMLEHQGGSNMAVPSLRAESRKLEGDSASRVDGSILSNITLHGTFRRISQLWDNAHTLNLEYMSSLFIVYNITLS